VSGSTVVDISGNGLNGTLNGGAVYSSSDRSLNQDATGDSIYISNIGNPAGAWAHSISFWIYFIDLTSDRIFEVSSGSTANKIPHFVLESGGDVRWDFYQSNIRTTSQPIAANRWYHIALSYNGGVHGLTNSKIYINGVSSASEDNGSGDALNIDANKSFYIGSGTKQRISNFKLWSGVALTAEEVAQEYALGRTGKSLNVTDTAVCLGGTVPRAQLDVRGSAVFGGNVGVGTTSPGYKLDVHGDIAVRGNVTYPMVRWEVDLTSQSNSNFYPIEFKHLFSEGTPDLPDYHPIHFKIFGESLGGSNPYNENTLVGYAKGGGWSDHGPMYDIHIEKHTASENRFQGLYEGTTDYAYGIIIYMRGGYRYSAITDANEVVTHTSSYTAGGSTFAIKNANGNDVSGTSANIAELVDMGTSAVKDQRWVSGCIKQRDLPAFYAYINTTSSTTSATIPFNTTVFNNGSHFNTSTGIFTAPIDGYYIFTASLGDNDQNEFSGKIISFYKDDVVFRDIVEGETGHAAHFETSASTVVYLENGSTFYVRMRSGSVTLNSGADGPAYRCSFSGALIG